MNHSLPITQDLTQIFPDIEGQLCSRHSILMGKLKNTFNKIYDSLDPTHYTILKGLLTLYHNHQVDLSMALQNGVILMSREIGAGQSVYISSNNFDEQIIFSAEGKLEEGLNEHSEDISTVIKLAGEGLPAEELKGGILYLHSNIVQNAFNYREIMLVSLFLGMSVINNTLKNFSIQQLIDKLAKYDIFGDKYFLEKLFNYKNRQFQLKVGDQQFEVPLEKQNKLILCQVDLAKMDIKFQNHRRQQLQQLKQHVLKKVKEQTNLNSLFEVFDNAEQVFSHLNLNSEIQSQNQDLTPSNYVEIAMKELQLLCQFNNHNITFEQLISAQWELNSQYWKIHPQQVVQLIQQIKNTLGINSCLIINQSYALIVANKSKYTELLVFLRQKIHKGELKSKSLFKIEEELIQHRWSSDKHIGEKMFTSVPSCAVSVFDPSSAIWFE